MQYSGHPRLVASPPLSFGSPSVRFALTAVETTSSYFPEVNKAIYTYDFFFFLKTGYMHYVDMKKVIKYFKTVVYIHSSPHKYISIVFIYIKKENKKKTNLSID